MKSPKRLFRFMVHGPLFMAMLLMTYSQVLNAQLKTQTLKDTPGQELSGGTIYLVNNTMTLDGRKTGTTGLTVGTNATVTIYVAAGADLRVYGANGNMTDSGKAGIYVPKGSTLILTGAGRVYAYGGSSGKGGDGGRGGNAYLDWRQNKGHGGDGGRGGNGGGGAAAGIGGNGGLGAIGQNGPSDGMMYCNGNDFDGDGVGGNSAVDGEWGKDMGTVYVLGTVSVFSYLGKSEVGGNAGNDYGSWATDSGSGWCNNYTSGGGGPGGGGGSGYAAICGIGGGSRGGQSGSTGGSGGTMKNSSGRDEIKGAGGRGGNGGQKGQDSNRGASSAYNKSGGCAGSVGTYKNMEGDAGSIYVQDTKNLSYDGKRPAGHDVALVTSIPTNIRRTYTLDANGGTSNATIAYVYYGIKPANIATSDLPTNGSKSFAGFFSQKEGGVMVYDATGKAQSVFTGTENAVIYARWYDGYIEAQNGYFLTDYKKADGVTVERIAEDGKFRDITVDANGYYKIEGGVKICCIYKDGKLERSYLPAIHENKVCLYEEVNGNYLNATDGSTVIDKRGTCNHALSSGRSAYIGTSNKVTRNDTIYMVKSCRLCQGETLVATNNNYVQFNGQSWFDTGYVPNANTQLYAQMQYELKSGGEDFLSTQGDMTLNHVPMCNNCRYSTSVSVYETSEFPTTGMINALSYYCSSEESLATNSLKIYLGYFDGTLSDDSDFSKIEGLTLVYSGNPTIGGKIGWETFQLQNPFKWDAHKNLAVVVCRKSPDYNISLRYRVHDGISLQRTSDIYDAIATIDYKSYLIRDYFVPDMKLNIKGPTYTFGARNGDSTYGLSLANCSNNVSSSVAYPGNGTEVSNGRNDSYNYTDYDVLMENGSMVVSESELPTNSLINLQWNKLDKVPSNTLYLGALNNAGTANKMFSGKVYGFLIMEKGVAKHSFIPAVYNGKIGFYDEVTDTFKEVQGTGAAKSINPDRCSHYLFVTKENGEIKQHCMVCDKVMDTEYYLNIEYDKGTDQDANGSMLPQSIETQGRLNTCRYTKPMRKFAGWSTTSGGTVSYSDQNVISCSPLLKDKLKLYAVWKDCYAVCGDTLTIPDGDVVTDTTGVVDDNTLYYGFSTRRKITMEKFAYLRKLKEGTVWGTICLPIAVNTTDTLRFYSIAQVTDQGQLILKVAKTVEANHPCIFRVMKSGIRRLLFTGDNVAFDGSIDNSVTEQTGLHLVGTYDYLQKNLEGDSCYAISGNTFYKVKSSIDVCPFRAYIQVDAKNAGARQTLYLVDEDETGIESLEGSNGSNGFQMVSGGSNGSNGSNGSSGKFLKNGRMVISHHGKEYNVDGTVRRLGN